MELSESELLVIQRAVGGDTYALQSLLQAQQDRLLNYVKKHLPPELSSTIDPQDIVQDTCFDACRLIAGFRPTGADCMFRWLVTIARCRMLDQIKAQKSRPKGMSSLKMAGDDGVGELLGQLAVYRRTPSRSAASHEFMLALEQAIGRLPEDYRQAVTLRHIEGLSVAEAAVRMSRPSEAVYVLCCRALKAIRADLESASLYI